jgi:O-antigen ligase
LDTVDQTRLRSGAIALPAQWPSRARIAALIPNRRRIGLGLAAAAVLLATVLLAAFNQHSLYFKPGLVAQAIRFVAPMAAGLVAAWAIFDPRRALLVVLLLTPCWNATQVSLDLGPIQVILQTIFVAALVAGTLRWRRSQGAAAPVAGEGATTLEPEAIAGPARPPRRFAILRRPALPRHLAVLRRAAVRLARLGVAEKAALGLAAVAILSTEFSFNPTLSGTVLMHGVLEPLALGAIVIALRPSLRDILNIVLVLGASAGLGAVINILQMLPVSSLAALQAERLTFARVTYFNVGLYGIVLTAVVPLVIVALVARRSLPLPRRAGRILAAILVACLVGLLLSLSKSAFLATTGGVLLLSVLLVQTWKRRAAIVVTAVLLSSIVIPWPTLFLQAAPPLDNAYRSAAVTVMGQSRFDSWNPSTRAGYGSMTERVFAIEGAVHMAADHPLLGVGLDQFGRYYVRLGYKPAQAVNRYDHAHSLFPEIAAELGPGAVALVLLTFGSILLALWRLYRKPPDWGTRALAAAFMASLVAWLVATTAFGLDIYRPDRELSSDVVAVCVIAAAAIALVRISRRPPELAGAPAKG